MANYLDLTGLQALWAKIKAKFISQPAANTVTAGHIATLTKTTANGQTTIGVADSGYTIASNVPANAAFTDQSVTSVSNHYKTSGADTGTLGSSTARYYIKTITTDDAGHVTGVSTGNETVTNTASIGISTNESSQTVISNSETPGKFLVIAGGTNKFTITDEADNAFDISITPSITDNVTGSGTSGSLAIWNGTNTITSRSILTEVDNTTGIPTSGAVKTYVDNATAGLVGAMHYCGWVSTEITDGSTTSTFPAQGNPGLIKTTGFISGDVVSYNTKEFVWNGTAWRELGDEGSHALKTITITGTGALSGGGTLESNRTITHNTSGVHSQDLAQAYGPSADVTGSNGATLSVPQIKVDKYGHITEVTERTYTAVDTTYSAGTGISKSGSTFSADLNSTTSIGTIGSGGVLAVGVDANGKLAVQSVAHTAGTGISLSNGTISVKLNSNTSLGTIGTTADLNAVGVDANGKLCVNVPTYSAGTGLSKSGNTLSANLSSNTSLGTIGTGAVVAVGVDSDGYLAVAAVNAASNGVTLSGGTVSADLKDTTKNTNASLAKPTANANRLYPIELDKNGKLAVTVPWEDHQYSVHDAKFAIKAGGTEVSSTSANSDTASSVDFIAGTNITLTPSAVNKTITIDAATYSAGTGLSLSGTTLSAKLDSNTSLGTIGTTSGLKAVGVDANGKLAVQTDVYSANNGVSLSGTTFSAALVNTTKSTNAATRPDADSTKYYAVELDKNGKLAVVVPWQNSQYSVNDGKFSVIVGSTEVSSTSANTSNASSITFEGTGGVSVTGDSVNHKISIAGTTYSAGTGLSLSGTTFSAKLNSDTSLGTIGTDKVYAVGVDANGKLCVKVPWTDHTYSVHDAKLAIKGAGTEVTGFTANSSTAASVDIVAGNNVSVTADATSHTITIAADAYTAGTGLSLSSKQFSLSKATTSAIGGMIASNALTSDVTLTSADGAAASRYYGVQVDKTGKAFVNIPWTDGSTTSTGHYTPSGSAMTISNGDASAYALNTEYTVLTGISVSADSKGHVTAVSTTRQKIKDTNTTYGSGTAANVSGADGTAKVWTGAVLKSAIEAYGGVSKTGTVTSVATGTGLTGGTITDSGTLKANLNSEASLGTLGTTSKLYAVGVDANGKLCVNVPWTDSDTDTKVTAVGNHYTPSGGSNLTTSNGDASAYALNTEYTVLTGVTIKADAAGHITAVSTTRQKIKDTNTTYSALTNAEIDAACA